MEHNYFNTFIAAAEDTKATAGVIPKPGKKGPSVAEVQYELLAERPFGRTQEDVLFLTWLRRNHDEAALAEDEIAELRRQFYSKGQPCLRASPLTKTHGWGVLFDSEGKAALVSMDSPDYAENAARTDLKQLKAMRSKRA